MKHQLSTIKLLKLHWLLLVCFLVVGQQIFAKKLDSYMSYTTFYSPESGPYIETYLSVDGNTVEFVLNENNKYQASIQVLLLFKNGEEIVNYDKYELLSPEYDDTLSVNFSFQYQQRYSLENGNYEFEIQIWDVNSEEAPFINVQPLAMSFPEDEIVLSGIQLVDSYQKTEEPNIYTKNGYDLMPYISNFFPENKNTLTFYSELYNAEKVIGKDEKYLLSYFIEQFENNARFDNYVSFRRDVASEINVVFSEFDITDLKSGNYFLTIEVKDRNNNLVAKNRIFFQRSNPRVQYDPSSISSVELNKSFASKIYNLDTLREYVRCLMPIALAQEQNYIKAHVNKSDLETLQKFFYIFWYDRDKLEPQRAWENYLNEVNKVELAYATSIDKGYETDRGRVYLQYGPPNAISESYNEPSAYPYEIWHYYVIGNGQRNKRFVFYTKDIVTNDFVLLHSDVAGELSNYRWQLVLNQRVDPGNNIDQSETRDSWGDNSKRYFDLPR
jgi:GWxTD domain-containing protein